MSRIAIVNIGLHGHVNPTMGFTEELVRRGHDVVYFGDPVFTDKVERTGARFREYGTKFSQNLTLTGRRDSHARFLRFVEEAEETLPRLLALLEEENPDVVVYDFISVAARLAVEMLGLSAVKFFTTYAASDSTNPLKRLFSDDLEPALEAEIQERFKKLCHRFGFEGAGLRDLIAKPEKSNLIFMPHSFHPDNEHFDERFHFVGPCLRRADGLLADDLTLKGGQPLILVSLGTLFHDWPEFYRDCMSAFAGQPWRVAMSVGPKIEIASLGRIPDNVYVRPHLPQLDLLALAGLFVSHGGMNSTMEALHFGVPLIVIPQMEEQAFTARRIDDLKLGVHLNREAVSSANLLEAVNRVLGSAEIRQNCARVQKELHAAGGTERAVAVIEKAFAHGDLPSAPLSRKVEARSVITPN